MFWPHRAAPVAALIAAAVLPLAVGGTFNHHVMALLACYAIAAVGLDLLVGVAGQISLGQGAFMAIGGYGTAFLTAKAGMPLWLGIPLAGVFAAVAGLLLALPAVRLRGPFLALATLSFGAALPQVATKWEVLTGGSMGMAAPKLPSDLTAYWVILAVLAFLSWVARNVMGSRPGRALVAVRESEVAALAAGIDLARAKTAVFALAAFYGGVAGALATHLAGFISPLDFNLLVSFQLLAAIVVGGLGSVPGAIGGAVLVGYLPFAFSRSGGWATVAEGLAIIAVVMFLPRGLVGLPDKIAGLRRHGVT